ncbi:RNase H1/viroplasmin domain-containing protein [uncultured Mitsuokella sp.]|uniref:RNase H1/viroplasmin domain-containing protein n=1 Tax=uncultured Mitsuokella sp. TaxID=453120 RepID=UPI00266FFC2A|nr:RNase H1/viroplasmin domain-containing protein [uncultured Mitsuokella sp.]
MAKKKYYAVAKGNKVGIFQSWAECAAAVKGYSGARYRGFPDSHSAACWYFEELGKVDEARQARRKQPKQKQPNTVNGGWRFIPASEQPPVLNPETWDGRIAHKWDEKHA